MALTCDFIFFIIDGFVKSPDFLFFVIPAKVRRGGSFQTVPDSRFHGSDDFEIFYEFIITRLRLIN